MSDLSKLAHDATERHQVMRALGTLSVCYGVKLYEVSEFNYRVIVEAEDGNTTHNCVTLAEAALVMVIAMLRVEHQNPERASAARAEYAELMGDAIRWKDK